jgi:hypothetical protein
VCRRRDLLSESLDLVEDFVSGSSPDERHWVPVVVVNILLDLDGQFFDTSQCSSPDRYLGNDVEPEFDLVQP